jgi:hypothetical protein
MSLEVWLSLPFEVNRPVFEMWVAGEPAARAARRRQQPGGDLHGFGSPPPPPPPLPQQQQQQPSHHSGAEDPQVAAAVLQDTEDQYRQFEYLTPLLQAPLALWAQVGRQVAAADAEFLLARYYAYDDEFMLDVAGMNLDRKLALDDVPAARTLALASCLRQFTNLRRLARAVESAPGRLSDAIAAHTRLPPAVCGAYAALVFLAENRIVLDKRNLEHIPLAALLACVQELMRHWTPAALPGRAADPAADGELDRRFLKEMTEVRGVFTLDDLLLRMPAWQPAALVRPLLGHVLQLGFNLSHSKELRDLFEDLVERVLGPCWQAHWPAARVAQLLDDTAAAADALAAALGDAEPQLRALLPALHRYLRGLRPIILLLHAYPHPGRATAEAGLSRSSSAANV